MKHTLTSIDRCFRTQLPVGKSASWSMISNGYETQPNRVQEGAGYA